MRYAALLLCILLSTGHADPWQDAFSKAGAAHETGRHAEARAVYGRALELAVADGNQAHIARTATHLGDLLWQLGEQKAAMANHDRALAAFETILVPAELRNAWNEPKRSWWGLLEREVDTRDWERYEGLLLRLAGHATETGDHQKALQCYEKALVIRRVRLGDHHRDVARLLASQADALVRAGRTAEAERTYHTAVDVLSATVYGPEVAPVREQLATLVRSQGRADEADRLDAEAKQDASSIWSTDPVPEKLLRPPPVPTNRPPTNQQVRLLPHHGSVVAAAFSPDGRWLYTANDGPREAVHVWRCKDWVWHQALPVGAVAEGGLVVAGERLFIATSKGIVTYSTASWQQGRCFGFDETDSLAAFAVSCDGSRAVWSHTTLVGTRPTIQVMSLSTAERTPPLLGHDHAVCGLAFSPDRCGLASASSDDTVRLWSLADGICRRVLRGHDRSVLDVTFSPDGTSLLSASDDGTARLWDVASGSEWQVLRGHGGGVRCAVFTPDGRGVVTAGWDWTLRLWDVSSGKERRRFRGHGDGLMALAVSPNGRFAVSGGMDGRAIVWSLGK